LLKETETTEPQTGSIRDDITVKEGDSVLLYLAPRKSWLVKAGDADLHTHAGIINLKKIIGMKFGQSVESSLGRNLTLLRPRLPDKIMRIQRLTQIVYPKDMGLISALTGLGNGDIVVECGTGSGALTIFLANAVSPTGRVYTFESRRDFAELAAKNIRKAGLEHIVELNVEDFSRKEKFPFKADVAVVDVGDPWTIVPQMRRALKGSGFLVGICPTFNQAEKLVTTLEGNEFVDIGTYEVILRPIDAREGRTRPSTRMVIAHSAFLTFARKST
jgi:tRNA (adenine57-N1/adenine58-N1)-methyltransferase